MGNFQVCSDAVRAADLDGLIISGLVLSVVTSLIMRRRWLSTSKLFWVIGKKSLSLAEVKWKFMVSKFFGYDFHLLAFQIPTGRFLRCYIYSLWKVMILDVLFKVAWLFLWEWKWDILFPYVYVNFFFFFYKLLQMGSHSILSSTENRQWYKKLLEHPFKKEAQQA